jgi:hypothetical protein
LAKTLAIRVASKRMGGIEAVPVLGVRTTRGSNSSWRRAPRVRVVPDISVFALVTFSISTL